MAHARPLHNLQADDRHRPFYPPGPAPQWTKHYAHRALRATSPADSPANRPPIELMFYYRRDGGSPAPGRRSWRGRFTRAHARVRHRRTARAAGHRGPRVSAWKVCKEFARSAEFTLRGKAQKLKITKKKWSGRLDSNQRPPAPKLFSLGNIEAHRGILSPNPRKSGHLPSATPCAIV
jgi:hypothetical protein